MALFAQGLLLALIVWELLRTCQTFPHVEGGRPLIYSRETLLSLRYTGTTSPPADVFNLPETFKILPSHRKLRRRGRRGGIQLRLRRRGMILSNARSLRSKMEALRTNMRVCFEYREAGLLVFTETWLHKDIPNSLIELEGFSLVRADRNETSGKSRGGGICVFVSDSWCRNHSVRETVCSPDTELLCISLRPFYLPREFGNIVICSVYVPPSSNAARVAARIADCVHNQLQHTPGAPVFILGDFNHCKLELSLPGFEQYVKWHSRQ